MNNKREKHDDRKCEPVPCFTAGSLALTKSGLKLVEDIRPGDLVLSRDSGYKEVIWAGTAPGMSAVLYDDTIFSPQHRILRHIDNEEVLVPAKHLVKCGVAIDIVKPVMFVHFMFYDHEIVNVNGIWSESFYPGDWIMKNTPQGTEIKKLFGDVFMQLARPVSKFKQGAWQIEKIA